MSDTPVSTSAPASHDAAPALGVGLLLAAVAIILANTNVQEGENGGTGAMIGTLIFIGVVAALIYFLLLPRVSSATVAVAVGVIAVVTVVAYWSGLPFVLGATAFVLGRRAAPGTPAVVAQVLGAVAVVAGVAALIADKAS
ncbi:MAG: hypothetical protein ACXV2I_14115 [Actinomycetes bacterium]